MMVNVLTKIVIDRPVGVVADYAAHPDNAPAWYVNIRSAKRLPDQTGKIQKPMTVGSEIAFTAYFLGRELNYTYEIKAFVPGQKLVMRTAEGPFPMETTYTWEAVGKGQTLMTLRNAGQPSGFSRIFAPLMITMMRKANRKDLKRLKKILEDNPDTEV